MERSRTTSHAVPSDFYVCSLSVLQNYAMILTSLHPAYAGLQTARHCTNSGKHFQTQKDRMSASKPLTALAIDIGYGQVKLSRRNKNGSIEFMSFPSIAVPADPSLMRGLHTRARNTFDVSVGDARYEVGVDVTMAQTGNDFGREITDSWVNSPIYEALMKGALRYQGETKIDMLYLGLPVSHYLVQDRQDALRQMYENKQIDLGDSKTVSIGRVHVVPQPLGGFLELADHLDALNQIIVDGGDQFEIEPLKSAEDIRHLTMLVVDPGENTLDWLFVQQGTINTKASGATSDAGRHRIVRAVAEALEAKLGAPVNKSNLPRINDALRGNWKLKLNGKFHDLTEYRSVVQATVRDPINRLIEGLKGLDDRIDVIGVVGGHPEFYRDELQLRFQNIPIFVSQNSIFANLRGYQALANEAIRRSEANA